MPSSPGSRLPTFSKGYAGAVMFTHHAERKMRFHGLSESRVRRALRSPTRVEEGIAPTSIAFVHVSPPAARSEVWVLIVLPTDSSPGVRHSVRVLSAWRYPGRTKPGTPLPEFILSEVAEGDGAR